MTGPNAPSMKPVLPVLALVATLLLAGCQHDPVQQGDGPRPIAIFDTNMGEFRVELLGDLAPQTVRNFGELAQQGHFDGTRFHRVIGPSPTMPDGFMNQGGDPNSKTDNKASWGFGGPGYSINDEFPCQDGTISNQHRGMCQGRGGLALTHDGPGILSMANSDRPRTGGSQFFVTVTATPWLDGAHAIFGRVVEGMEVVYEINRVETDNGDRPLEDVFLESVSIEGDLPDVRLEKF
jgi:cyclophilin family peptidyl-prolyl cis-trans isomerase